MQETGRVCLFHAAALCSSLTRSENYLMLLRWPQSLTQTPTPHFVYGSFDLNEKYVCLKVVIDGVCDLCSG